MMPLLWSLMRDPQKRVSSNTKDASPKGGDCSMTVGGEADSRECEDPDNQDNPNTH